MFGAVWLNLVLEIIRKISKLFLCKSEMFIYVCNVDEDKKGKSIKKIV